MNLVLDLGNTCGKIAVCEGPKVLESAVYDRITSREISYFHIRYQGIQGAIVSSVINESRRSSITWAIFLKPALNWTTTPPSPLSTGIKLLKHWDSTGLLQPWGHILFIRERPFWS
jgi:hypothetical protein